MIPAISRPSTLLGRIKVEKTMEGASPAPLQALQFAVNLT